MSASGHDTAVAHTNWPKQLWLLPWDLHKSCTRPVQIPTCETYWLVKNKNCEASWVGIVWALWGFFYCCSLTIFGNNWWHRVDFALLSNAKLMLLRSQNVLLDLLSLLNNNQGRAWTTCQPSQDHLLWKKLKDFKCITTSTRKGR